MEHTHPVHQKKADFHQHAYEAVLTKLRRRYQLSDTQITTPKIMGKHASEAAQDALSTQRWKLSRDIAVERSGLPLRLETARTIDALSADAIACYLQTFWVADSVKQKQLQANHLGFSESESEEEMLQASSGASNKIVGILSNHVLNRTIHQLRELGLSDTGAQALSGAIIREATKIQYEIAPQFARVEPQLGALPNGFTQKDITVRGEKIRSYWQDMAKELGQEHKRNKHLQRQRTLREEESHWR